MSEEQEALEAEVEEVEEGQPIEGEAAPEEQEGSEGEGDDAEARARRMGWAPQDEWRGDPERWKTAEEFLAFAEDTPAVLRERLEKYDRKLSEFDGEKDNLTRQISMLTKRLKEQDQRGYERAMSELKKQKRAAVEAGDMEAFSTFEEQEEELRKEAAEATKDPEPEDKKAPPPEVKEWTEKTTWWNKDAEMTKSAEGFSQGFYASNPDGTVKDMLAYVDERIRRAYPEKFENPNRRTAPKTNGPGTSARGGKKTFADLPPDARKACQEFVEDGIFATKEEYVADYFAQEAGR